MWNPRLAALFLLASLLAAQPARDARPSPAVQAAARAPVLRAGEGFAITLGEGEVHAFGEARREAPMGSLAKLVWMKLEGGEWSASGVQYRCKGAEGPFVCWNREGHGRVDLSKALQESCNLAFLAWISGSRERWAQDYGPDAARARLEEAFAPFLGNRLPRGEGLPPLTAAWVGDGDLLRASPEAFLRWLMDPAQTEVATFGKRYLAGFWAEVKDLFGVEGWWFKTGTGPVPGDPSATSAWVAGGRGEVLVVLHLPRGRGKQEGLVRIREILGLKP